MGEVKLKGENYSHVKMLFDELVKLNKRWPIILRDGDGAWHMDESAVETEFGKRLTHTQMLVPTMGVLFGKVIIRTRKACDRSYRCICFVAQDSSVLLRCWYVGYPSLVTANHDI